MYRLRRHCHLACSFELFFQRLELRERRVGARHFRPQRPRPSVKTLAQGAVLLARIARQLAPQPLQDVGLRGVELQPRQRRHPVVLRPMLRRLHAFVNQPVRLRLHRRQRPGGALRRRRPGFAFRSRRPPVVAAVVEHDGLHGRGTAFAPRDAVAPQPVEQHLRVFAHALRHARVRARLELDQEQRVGPRSVRQSAFLERTAQHHVGGAPAVAVGELGGDVVDGVQVEVFHPFGDGDAQKVRLGFPQREDVLVQAVVVHGRHDDAPASPRMQSASPTSRKPMSVFFDARDMRGRGRALPARRALMCGTPRSRRLIDGAWRA